MASTQTFDIQVVVTVNGNNASDRARAVQAAQSFLMNQIATQLLPQLANTYIKSANASENQSWPTKFPNVTVDITATES